MIKKFWKQASKIRVFKVILSSCSDSIQCASFCYVVPWKLSSYHLHCLRKFEVCSETATQTANISFCFEFMRWNIAGDESLVSRYNHCNFQLKSPVYKPEGSTLSEERHWEYGHIISFFSPSQHSLCTVNLSPWVRLSTRDSTIMCKIYWDVTVNIQRK